MNEPEDIVALNAQLQLEEKLHTPPGPGEKQVKVFKLKEGQLKLLWWCPQCDKWVHHKPRDHTSNWQNKFNGKSDDSKPTPKKGPPTLAKKKMSLIPPQAKTKEEAHKLALKAFEAQRAAIESSFGMDEMESSEEDDTSDEY